MLTYQAWRPRRVEGNARGLAWLLSLMTLWAACSTLWLLHESMGARAFLLKLGYVSLTGLPVAWVFFVLEFTHQPRLKLHYARWLLLIIPILTQLSIWTNPAHHLFWRDETTATTTLWWAGDLSLYGPWFWVHTGYSYLLVILGAIPILQIVRRSTHRYRQQALLLLFCILILLLGSTLVWLKNMPFGQQIPTGFLVAFSGLLFLWGIYRYQLLDQISLTRSEMIENTREGIVILDAFRRVADMNHLAHLLLNIPIGQAIGEPAERVFTPWPLWAPHLHNGSETHGELAVDRDHNTQWLEVHSRPLHQFQCRRSGTLLTLQDISDRKWAEQALEARRQELAELNALSRAIASSLSLHEVLQSIVNAVMRLFPAASDATVQLLEAQQTQLRTRICAAKHLEDRELLSFGIGEGLAGIAAQTRSTLNIPDVLEDPRFIRQKGAPFYRSMLVTPLLFGAQVLGTLSIVAPSPHAFEQDEARLLEDLARFAAIAVQNAHLYAQAQAEIAERKQVVAALRKNELRYRALFEHTNDAVFIIGLDGRYISANQQATAMLGYTLEELLACHPDHVIVPEELDDAHRRLDQLKAGMEFPIYERKFRCKDGRILATEISIALIHDPDGNPLHIQSIVRDITQRKTGDEALRQSEEKHRLLLDSIQSPVLALDHDMRILYCNAAYGDYVGMATETLTGQDLGALFPKFGSSNTHVTYRRCLETRQPQTIEGWSGELYFKARIYPTPWGLLAIADDATEQKCTQDTLQRYAERLQVLHEIDRAILAAQSPEAIALTAIQQIRRLIPCQRSLIIEFDAAGKGKLLALENGRAAPAPTDWDETLHTIQLLQHEQVMVVENLEAAAFRSPLQERLYNEGLRAYLWAPLVVLEQPIGLLCLEADHPDAFQKDHAEIAGEIAASLAVAIRQARLNEQTQQDAAIKTVLIDKINHRVKNNLASIIGLVFMAQRHLEPAAQEVCAPVLERLANQIHTLSAVHQMLSSAEWQMLPLAALAEQVLQATLQTLTPQARISVAVSPSPIKTDSKQANGLALILHELTTNTVKHGVGERPVAHIAIRIDTETPGPWGAAAGVRLEFRDDGPGYPEAVLEQGQQRMGLYLIQRLVAINLRGTVTLNNDGGAVAILRFAMPEQNNTRLLE